MEKFYDLSFSRQPDGSIRLLQSDCGGDYIIDAHPEPIKFMAHQLCGRKLPPNAISVAEGMEGK